MDSTDLSAFCEGSIDDVYRYALRLTGGHPTETADLVQDTFTTLLRHHQQHPTQPVRLAWLITCCRHRHLDVIKKRSRRDPPANTDPVDDHGAVIDALAQLDPIERTAIESGRVWVEQVGLTSGRAEVAPDAADAVIRSVVVGWTSFEGLSQTSYYAPVERRGASGALPPGYTTVGDHLCHEMCVDQSSGPAPPVVIPQSGALAGTPFQDRSPDYLGRSNGVTYGISAPSLDVANSLVAVSD